MVSVCARVCTCARARVCGCMCSMHFLIEKYCSTLHTAITGMHYILLLYSLLKGTEIQDLIVLIQHALGSNIEQYNYIGTML